MPTKITDELKAEILGMSGKEKDKLLLRLISKDKVLVDQLQYRLLENEEIYLQERAEAISKEILNLSPHMDKDRDKIYIIRTLSAKINYHKKVTADKITELRLWVELMAAFRKNSSPKNFFSGSINTHKFLNLFVRKVKAVIKIYESVHEDYRIEFTSELNAVLTLIYGDSQTKYTAAELKIPRELDL